MPFKSQSEAFLAEGGPESPDETGGDGSDPEEALEFDREAHLRDFLAKNLERIETGLRLHEPQERSGVEFPVDGGRIELLAIGRNEKFA